MTIVKRVFKGLAVLVGITIFAGTIFIASDWLYYKRLYTFDRTNSMNNMEWFENKTGYFG